MIQSFWNSLCNYLRSPALVSSVAARNELRDEIQFHLVSSIEDEVDRGREPKAAKKVAIERFGDLDSVIRDCGGVDQSTQFLWHRLHLAITLGLLGVVGCLAYVFSTEAASETVYANSDGVELVGTDPDPVNYAAGYVAESTTGDVTGSVIDLEGEPISSANLMIVVKTWPPNGYRQQTYMTTTGPNGLFELANVFPEQFEHMVQVTAISEGHILASEMTDIRKGSLDPFEFRLGQSIPFELRFESENGEPLAGVAAFPHVRNEKGGKRHTVYYIGSDPIVRKTGRDGVLSMAHFLSGEKVCLSVQFPGGKWQEREIVVPEFNKQVVVRQIQNSGDRESEL